MENKKQYIIISPFFPNDNNHAGSYVYDQAKTLIDITNYDIKVIKVVSIFSNEKDYLFRGIKVKIFRVFDFPFFIFPGIFNFINSFRIKQFFNKHNYLKNLDVIHAHVCYPSAYLANAVSSIVKVKTIAQHHGIDALQLLNGRLSFFTKLQKETLKNRSLNQLNKIGLSLIVSNRVRLALHSYSNYEPKNEFILYNGVDRDKFYNTNSVKTHDNYLVGSIANFWPIKDHISLIKAIELLVLEGITDIQLKLIGTGETLQFCKNYVKNHNLSKFVFFEKERSHDFINSFYNEIDLFVLSSYYEASACVLMESWATETPILSIKNQGISELIPEYEINNLLADEKSPISLKEKILGEYHRKRSYPFDEKYDIKNTIKEFMNYSFFKSDD
jgi:glycosyltransferase involved in cell wall biosynthesis